MPVTFESAITAVFMIFLIVCVLSTVVGSIWRREHDDMGKGA